MYLHVDDHRYWYIMFVLFLVITLIGIKKTNFSKTQTQSQYLPNVTDIKLSWCQHKSTHNAFLANPTLEKSTNCGIQQHWLEASEGSDKTNTLRYKKQSLITYHTPSTWHNRWIYHNQVSNEQRINMWECLSFVYKCSLFFCFIFKTVQASLQYFTVRCTFKKQFDHFIYCILNSQLT